MGSQWRWDYIKDWALSTFLFAMVMDRLTDQMTQESVMFADDIAICIECRE